MTDSRKDRVWDLVPRQMLADRPFRCRVTSGSMSPVFRSGDHILVEPLPVHALRPGHIVQLYDDHQVVSHRLLEIQVPGRAQCVLTKGDRVLASDAPWPSACLSGRVVAVDRNGRWLDLDHSLCHAWATRLLLWEWRLLPQMPGRWSRRLLHGFVRLLVGSLMALAWSAARRVPAPG